MAAVFFTSLLLDSHIFATRFSQVLTYYIETPFLDWRCPEGC